MPAAAGKHCTGKHCTQRDYTLYTYHGPVIIEGILVETVISFEYNNNIWPRKRLWRKNNLSIIAAIAHGTHTKSWILGHGEHPLEFF